MAAILESTLAASERRVLEDFAERVRARWGDQLERVAVFGSCARGDVSDESDVDVIVVLHMDTKEEDRATREAWELLGEAKRAIGAYPPVSLIVFSEPRFAELRARERRFALDIEAEGIRL